jgi:hypothetical protein
MMLGVPAVVQARPSDSENARLKARLETMPVIEQAKGIVMAREGCGPDEAFDLLRGASQQANVKVHVVAAVLVQQVAGHGGAADRGHQVLPPPRAGQFADGVRLDLDDSPVARVFRRTAPGAGAIAAAGPLLDEVLDFGLELLHAERGNVQLADPATGALRIAAQRGFGAEFLDYFAVVADDGSACGRAARRAAQVMIADVTTDPGFAPHRDIAAASGFRAVQSTPLIDTSGRLVGMVSTHYPRPVSLPARDLQVMARFGALTGAWLGPLLDAAQPALAR